MKTADDDIAALKSALDAGPTPGPWKAMSSKFDDDFGILAEDATVVIAETFSDIRREGEKALREAGMNANYIAAANPATISRLIARMEAAEANAARWQGLCEIQTSAAESRSRVDAVAKRHGLGSESLEARCEAAEADARRYRWLRDADNTDQHDDWALYALESLDEYIDAAIARGEAGRLLGGSANSTE